MCEAGALEAFKAGLADARYAKVRNRRVTKGHNEVMEVENWTVIIKRRREVDYV